MAAFAVLYAQSLFAAILVQMPMQVSVTVVTVLTVLTVLAVALETWLVLKAASGADWDEQLAPAVTRFHCSPCDRL